MSAGSNTSDATGFAGLETAHALGQRLFEGAADGHHFAHRFHLRPENRLGAREFLELPARDLDHHVVERRLEAGRRDFGDVVLDFIQTIADRQLRRDFRDREIRWLWTPARSCARRADSSPRSPCARFPD